MINDVLRLRGEEPDITKACATSTLRSLGSAVVVVDTDLRVQVWGPGADEQGRTEVVVEAMNRRGRHLSMVLERLLLQDDEGNRRGVIVVMNAVTEQT